MSMTRFSTLSIALLLALGGPATAGAIQEMRSPGGLTYLSGGVTAAESATIAASKRRFALAVLTNSKVSGGPLVDAHVRIVDAAGKSLLDADMDGPWLLAALAPGRYQLVLTFQDETQRRDIEILPAKQLEARFSFRSDAEVSLVRPR